MTISPSNDCWSRYDIDANFRVLAEWLGPGLPESSDLSRASVAQWRAGIVRVRQRNLWKFRTMAWLTCINRGGGQLDFPPTSPLTECSHFVLLRVSRRERLATFEKIRGRDRSPG